MVPRNWDAEPDDYFVPAERVIAQTKAATVAIEKLKDQYRAEGATIIGDEVIVPSNKESNG